MKTQCSSGAACQQLLSRTCKVHGNQKPSSGSAQRPSAMALFRNLQFMWYGSRHFGKEGYARASKTWDPSVMATRLDGRTVLITGANQGLGLQASEELASRGAKLLMVCRNEERGREAVAAVQAKTGNKDVHLKVCDISSLHSIKALVEDLRSSGTRVHVLINNAGAIFHERLKSADGYDMSFATNTLGAFALTLLMEDILKSSAPSKVIFVSSGGMLTQKLDMTNMQNEQGQYDGTFAYARDKRRQVAMAERFAELWGSQGVHVYSMHPGWTTTEGVKKSIPGFYNFFKDKFRELSQGADTVVYLALQDPAKLHDGAFYLDRSPQPKHLSLGCTTYTQRDVDTLWSQLLELTHKVLPGPCTGGSSEAAPAAAAAKAMTKAVGGAAVPAAES